MKNLADIVQDTKKFEDYKYSIVNDYDNINLPYLNVIKKRVEEYTYSKNQEEIDSLNVLIELKIEERLSTFLGFFDLTHFKHSYNSKSFGTAIYDHQILTQKQKHMEKYYIKERYNYVLKKWDRLKEDNSSIEQKIGFIKKYIDFRYMEDFSNKKHTDNLNIKEILTNF